MLMQVEKPEFVRQFAVGDPMVPEHSTNRYRLCSGFVDAYIELCTRNIRPDDAVSTLKAAQDGLFVMVHPSNSREMVEVYSYKEPVSHG